MTYDFFSVDDHIIEHARVWTDRLHSKYHDICPHVIEKGGCEYWISEGRKSAQIGLNAVAGNETTTSLLSNAIYRLITAPRGVQP